MLGALKNYAESQSKNGTLSPDLNLALKMVENMGNAQGDHITFRGESSNQLAQASINIMMELRSVKIDMSKIVDMNQVAPEIRDVLNTIASEIEKAVCEAYKDANAKIVNTISDAAR